MTRTSDTAFLQYRRRVLVATVREAARRYGERPAFVEVSADGLRGRLSYAELDRRSDEVAAGLAARGVGEGDVVALVLPTGLDFPICYAAVAKLGAVTAAVNTRLTDEERAAVLGVAGPALVIGEGGTDPAALAAAGERADPLEHDPERPVAIVFTSGTTGVPRGAVFAGRQLAHITRCDVGDGWGGGGRNLVATSLAHLGFVTKLPGGLRRGGTTFLLGRWRTADAIALTERLRLTTLAGIPTQLALMLRRPEFADLDLSSVGLVVMGGGPSTPSLVRRLRERVGVPVVVRYSCTEAGTGTGTRPDDPPEAAEHTVGSPNPGVDLHIRDGEVSLRSPAVMQGYWRDPEATRDVLTDDGFVRTGDVGEIDAEGRLRLLGRVRERYVRGGYNVQPVEVEAVLSTHPAVEDVAVVPVADDVMGEIGVACVVPGGAPPDLASLRAHAAGRLAAYKLPERLVVVDALPLTAGDKVDRRALTAIVSDLGR